MGCILVTGGAGFIGSHLVPALTRAGHRVRILDTLSPQIHGHLPEPMPWIADDPNISFLRGSVTDPADVTAALADAEAVIHLASETGTGQSMYQIGRYCSENVVGTAVLMDALSNGGNHMVRRVLLSSSRSVYGEGAYLAEDGNRVFPPPRQAAALAEGRWEPVDTATGASLRCTATRETDPTAPSSIYAATKLAQEDLVRIATGSLGIDFTILRLQNVYGEGQSLKNPYTGILSIFSTRIRRGMDLPIYEDGLESRDFVHVSDVAAAFLACLSNPDTANTTLNVGSGRATPVSEVATLLSDAFGAAARLRVTGEYRIGDIRHNFADTTRLVELGQWEPRIDLAAGLQRFADWVRSQPLPDDQLDRAAAEMKSRRMMGTHRATAL